MTRVQQGGAIKVKFRQCPRVHQIELLDRSTYADAIISIGKTLGIPHDGIKIYAQDGTRIGAENWSRHKDTTTDIILEGVICITVIHNEKSHKLLLSKSCAIDIVKNAITKQLGIDLNDYELWQETPRATRRKRANLIYTLVEKASVLNCKTNLLVKRKPNVPIAIPEHATYKTDGRMADASIQIYVVTK